MNKNTKIIIIATALLITAFIIYIFFYRDNKTPAGIDSVYKGQISNIEPTQNNLFFLSDDKLTIKSFNPSSGTVSDIYQSEAEISYYYPANDGSRVVVTADGENILFDVKNKKSQPLDPCWAATAWVDATTIISNCISQEYEYDPNTINNIEKLDLTSDLKTTVVDLKFEPPLKMITTGANTAIVITNNAGYATNDIYLLNILSGKLQQLTEDGYINDAKMAATGQLIYSTTKPDRTGVFLTKLDNPANAIQISPNPDINQIALANNYFYEISQENGRVVLFQKNISNPEQILARSDIETLGAIKQIDIVGDKIIMAGEQGLFTSNLTPE